MKKFLFALAAVAMTFAFSACSDDDKDVVNIEPAQLAELLSDDTFFGANTPFAVKGSINGNPVDVNYYLCLDMYEDGDVNYLGLAMVKNPEYPITAVLSKLAKKVKDAEDEDDYEEGDYDIYLAGTFEIDERGIVTAYVPVGGMWEEIEPLAKVVKVKKADVKELNFNLYKKNGVMTFAGNVKDIIEAYIAYLGLEQSEITLDSDAQIIVPLDVKPMAPLEK